MQKRIIIKSPLNYSGNKYKLMDTILQYLPQDISTFVDLFGGSGTVAANINSDTVIYNEFDEHIYNIVKFLIETPDTVVLTEVQNIIKEYALSAEDKQAYYNYRDVFNRSYSTVALFVLSCFSFSNLIRFNSSGIFNVPFGQRKFSKNTIVNVQNFYQAFQNKNIKLYNLDFSAVPLTDDSFVYVDPPYLNSGAIYNEQGGWNITEEERLRSYLDELNQRGVRWALSNDLSKNPTLYDWAVDKYKIIYVEMDYSSSFYNTKTQKGETKEVLIINYNLDKK